MMLKNVIFVLAASGLLLATAACNTVRGVGRDLESAADTVDRAT